MNDEIADLREQLEQTEELHKLTNVTLAKTARRLAKAEEFLLQRVRSIISTGEFWKYRGSKIPPAYRLLDDQTLWNDRDAGFYTDVEVISMSEIGQASRWYEGKYGITYFHNRIKIFQRDDNTCTVCGYKSKRRKGDVNDLEVHHIDPDGGNDPDNLRTVCLSCHRRLIAG